MNKYMVNPTLQKPFRLMWNKSGWQLVGVIAAMFLLLLPACSNPVKPLVSNQLTPTPSSCLVGIWSIRNPEAYFRYSIPPGAFDMTTLKFKDSVGGVAYRFDNQGVLTVEAVEFTGRFDVKLGADIAALVLKLNGFASGAYRIEGDIVRLEQVLSSDLQYSAIYSGESMMDTKQVSEFAPLFLAPYTAAKYECTSETLTLQILNFPSVFDKLEFQRLR